MAQVLLDRLQPDWDLSWEVEEQQQHMLAAWKLHVPALQAVRPAILDACCLSEHGHACHRMSLRGLCELPSPLRAGELPKPCRWFVFV